MAWLFAVWLARPILGGDTQALLRGARELARCLGDGSFVGCGSTTTLNQDGHLGIIGPFPFLQYPTALVAQAIGTTEFQRGVVLAVVSAVAFAASLCLTWLVLSRVGLASWTWGVVVVALTGPLLVYANATWGEMLACFLLLLLVAATVLQSHPALVALAGCGAALTKETGYPFVAAIALIGLWLAHRRTRSSIRAQLAGATVGLLAGVACASLLNVVRFGTVTNSEYLRPEFRAPAASVGESFLGLFVAPNGGLLVFWLSAAILLALVLLAPLYGNHPRDVADGRIAVALLATLVGVQVGLATWWSPFGWGAWGPRLTLPWVWPLLLLGLVAYGSAAGAATARFLASGWRFGVAAVVLALTTLPPVGFLWRPETIRIFFTAESEACVPGRVTGSAGYYACLHDQMWWHKPLLIDALGGLGTAGGAVTGIAVVTAAVGSLALLRDGLAAAPPASR